MNIDRDHEALNSPPDPTRSFLNAICAVDSHNNEHVGPLGVLPTTEGEILKSRDPSYVKPPTTPQEEAEFDAGRVFEEHEATLAQLGIKLDAQAPPYAFSVFGGVSPVDLNEIPKAIVMKVGEPQRFGWLIEQLDPADEDQELARTGVDKILAATIKDIKKIYRDMVGEDEPSTVLQRHAAEEQMDALVNLNPVLVANNYGNDGLRQELATCVIRYQDGTFTEYVRAEDLGLLDSNGPSSWVMYMRAPDLTARWRQSFDLLEDLRDREGESSFYPELFSKLKSEFNSTLKLLADKDAAHWAIGGDPMAKIEPLQEAMDELAKVWDEEFVLENLFHFDEGNEQEGRDR